MKKLFIARITIITSRASIITFVTRSSPFLSPIEHISTAAARTIATNSIIVSGSASTESKCSDIPAASRSASAPLAVEKKYLSIHPATVV